MALELFIRSLFRFLSWFPLPVLHGLGWMLGWLSFLSSSRYRRRLFDHARQAGFSKWVALSSVGESGKLVAELPRLWFGRPVRVAWEGAELVEAALKQSAGVLFLTPHLGCFEITAQAYAQRFGARQPVTVLFRPARQPWLRELVARARVRPNLETAPTTLGGVKQLLKAVRGGRAVGLLPDQVPPHGQGVWAAFFGRNAYTMTLSARLAHAPGVRVILIWGDRLSWGRGYVVRVRTFEAGERLSADPVRSAQQINRAMEGLVRECPAQYLWSYDRYKASGGPAPADAEPVAERGRM